MKLASLEIRNFGSIGPEPFQLLIDQIVVLIGPNNSGKSTILDAYEAFASSGSALPVTRFRNRDPETPIEMTGTFVELSDTDREKIADKWIHDHDRFEGCIRSRWIWQAPDTKGERSSWNSEEGRWVEKGTGGWDSILASCLPEPLRIRPESTAEEYEKTFVAILVDAVKKGKDDSTLESVMKELEAVSKKVSAAVDTEIQEACSLVSEQLGRVFAGHSVQLAPAADPPSLDKLIAAGSHLTVAAPGSGEPMPLGTQGAGVQRAFLWSALQALADSGRLKRGRKFLSEDKPRILLIDEPEAYLHPPSVRTAREALYAVAELTNWQVVATTHSPVFIDVAKPHTTIATVSPDSDTRQRVFQSERAEFDGDERRRLQMIRRCHPSVNEFFFADRVVLVEGETEQVVIHALLDRSEADLGTVHVVNCLGKSNIPLFMEVLDQFGTPYVVLHDSDSPRARRGEILITNPAWTLNRRIWDKASQRDSTLSPCPVLVHVPDFEGYYFGKTGARNKPDAALAIVQADDFENDPQYERLRALISGIVSGSHPARPRSISELEDWVREWVEGSQLTEEEREVWTFESSSERA